MFPIKFGTAEHKQNSPKTKITSDIRHAGVFATFAEEPKTTTLADLRGLFELRNSSLNENITLGHVSEMLNHGDKSKIPIIKDNCDAKCSPRKKQLNANA